ncbi:DUF1508 domain-containing protein [Natronomonas sp. F2-12]|jgi:uncharacterized protein YegP (UPF0339 family)|uniref:DUF1508 domain-containing protein n=1 Tax=Natronomonas aquatica TaxID=2841590 RepID=A0A9R1CWN5_9EURY|nr:DUF1508 domain-containing protein [Natronomonas aquatica]MCQ4334974.1 DUF1508 domain-containing protein [Natronomonas aquatica]
MAQSTADGPLTSIYENRIGDATNTNEVMGYWAFLVGVFLGLIGLILYSITVPATMSRGVGYSLAALAPALLMAGAVLRFPLRKTATTLVGVGLALTVAAVAWFLIVFPEGWSLTTGNPAVILSYVAGLAIIGIGGTVVPLATDPRDAALDASNRRAETAEEATRAARDNAAAAKRESEADSVGREEALQSEIDQLRNALSESESKNAGFQTEVDEQQTARSDTEADEAELAVLLNELRESESQFELYEDRGGAWRWRLRHQDGGIIASSSEGHATHDDAQRAMQAVRRDAHGATVLHVESEEDLPEPESGEGFIFADEVESQATFELYEDEGDKYRWRLRHNNGNMIAHGGQGYASRSGAEHSVKRIRESVGSAEYLHADPTAIEVYRDEANKWRWRLLHRNGNILAGSGEGYEARPDVRTAIDAILEDIGTREIEVYEDEAGSFRWRFDGNLDHVIADSGGYESRDGAQKAVERVRTFMPEADLIDVGEAAFEIYVDEGEEHRWRLRHRNGNVLASSGEGYASRSGVWDAIESVKRNAPAAEFEETDN